MRHFRESYIALYGGSFDPPHYAHRQILKTLYKSPLFHHVICMPNYLNPLKESALFSPLERFEMCKILAADVLNTDTPNDTKVLDSKATPGFGTLEVSDYEIMQNKPTFSIHTIKMLQHTYPRTPLAIVVGEDNFAHLHVWHKIDKLCEIAAFVVIGRDIKSCASIHTIKPKKPAHKPKARILERIHLSQYGELSSTQVRALLQNGQFEQALEMIPASLHTFIKAHFRL